MIIEKGTYILFFSNNLDAKIIVGSLGELFLEKGFYLYVGSAFGPGGLKKRIQRHLNPNKKIFWHIDYLSKNKQFILINIIEIFSSIKEECLIVNFLLENIFSKDEIKSIKNFGSSDCKCKSHLLYYTGKDIKVALKKIQNKFEDNQIKVTYF
ncbi:MAG: GIY-YIG nuclease family protein [Asgard group archaeon]|nr:GIY-YIG nuclease family protein [Asgard group archaeon]